MLHSITKSAACTLALMFLIMPVVTSADTVSDQLDQARFVLFRTAALQANFDPAKLTCLATTSVAIVHAHEKFILAWAGWGSQGQSLNTWAPSGAAMVAVDTPGTYRYEFSFFGANGTQTACETRVIVE